MDFWLATTIIVTAGSALLLGMAGHYLLRFGKMILKIQDTIEDALDILDERYESMSKVLEIPVFFDSVEVRQVIDDIERSREAILLVANHLTTIDKNQDVVSPEETDQPTQEEKIVL